MGKYLATHRIYKEFDAVDGCFFNSFIGQLRFNIGKNKLTGNINNFHRNIQQFTEKQINYSVDNGISSLGFNHFMNKEFLRMLVSYFSSFEIIVTINNTCKYVHLFQRSKITV